MRFFHRITSSVSQGSRASERRLATRRRSPISCEALEGRALMSNIPGVSLQFGNLQITATKAGGNVAEVSVNPTDHNIQVTFNGQSEEFAASKVFSVTYLGGKSGGDTFTNNTGLWEIAFGYGGHNTFTGGTSAHNAVYLVGNDNTYNAQDGSHSTVFEVGTGDTINAPTDAITYDSPAPWLNLG